MRWGRSVCVVLLAQLIGHARAQEVRLPSTPLTIGVRAHYGFLWPHRPASWYLVEGHAPAVEVFAERSVRGDRAWHHHHRLPTYGLAFLYTDMANAERIGPAVRVLPFVNLPVRRSDRSLIGIRMGWGIGYIDRAFERLENGKQIAIGSRINTAIQLMPEYTYIVKRFSLRLGLSVDHWSNGSYKQPNLGLNYVSVSAGVGVALGSPAPPVVVDTAMAYQGPRAEYNVVAAFGVNETATPLQGQRTVYSLSAQREWFITRRSALMAGADAFNKGTLADQHPELRSRPRSALTQVGVHGGYALVLGRGELYMHMGLYALTPEPDEAPVFHRVGMRYRSGKHLIWNIALKSHYAVADHWEFGMGYRW